MFENALSEARDLLAQKDYRLTPQREAILRALINRSDSHPSADEIYLATKEKFPAIGLATVYRTLDIFATLGIAYKHELGGSGSRYEFNPELKKSYPEFERHCHHHLICLECGKIAEFNEDLLEDIEEVVTRKTGFSITDHSLRFYGYCKECREKRE